MVKPRKRTFLRRKCKGNPVKRAKERADNALQESYRKNYPGELCEACGNPFKLMHHHIEKSQSLYARYMCPANLIFLCEFCHNQIHFYNRNPVSAYSIKRGAEWQKEMVKIRSIPAPSMGIKKLKEIEDYYLLDTPEKY